MISFLMSYSASSNVSSAAGERKRKGIGNQVYKLHKTYCFDFPPPLLPPSLLPSFLLPFTPPDTFPPPYLSSSPPLPFPFVSPSSFLPFLFLFFPPSPPLLTFPFSSPSCLPSSSPPLPPLPFLLLSPSLSPPPSPPVPPCHLTSFDHQPIPSTFKCTLSVCSYYQESLKLIILCLFL